MDQTAGYVAEFWMADSGEFWLVPMRLKAVKTVGDNVIGPFRVPDDIKMDSKCYIKLLTDSFFLWYRSQTCLVTVIVRNV